MKIELKKIKVYDKLSEETTAFTADIYADGKLIGHAKNTGHGGCTDAYSATGQIDQYKKVEAWLFTQPPIKFTWPGSEDSMELASNLENMVDYLLEIYLQLKEEKKIRKAMVTGIVYGIPGQNLSVQGYKAPLEVIAHNHPELLRKKIIQIKAELKPGEIIFNTDLLKQLGL